MYRVDVTKRNKTTSYDIEAPHGSAAIDKVITDLYPKGLPQGIGVSSYKLA